MSGIPLQRGIIYGPILSRRLGRSLGINLLPANKKICNFNCIYCQYGASRPIAYLMNGDLLPKTGEVIRAVEKALMKPRSIDYLTFSGNGEPTMHPDFPEILAEVRRIVDRIRPEVKLAILSNASRVMEAETLSALKLLDAPMMKLDAGDQETFDAINQPEASIVFQDILAGLAALPNLMIQSMLIDGKVSNIRGNDYDSWLSTLVSLNPSKVHIYSIDRPVPNRGIKPVPAEDLKGIAEFIRSRYQLDIDSF